MILRASLLPLEMLEQPMEPERLLLLKERQVQEALQALTEPWAPQVRELPPTLRHPPCLPLPAERD